MPTDTVRINGRVYTRANALARGLIDADGEPIITSSASIKARARQAAEEAWAKRQGFARQYAAAEAAAVTRTTRAKDPVLAERKATRQPIEERQAVYDKALELGILEEARTASPNDTIIAARLVDHEDGGQGLTETVGATK